MTVKLGGEPTIIRKLWFEGGGRGLMWESSGMETS